MSNQTPTPNMHDLKRFRDRIGKRIYRDADGCKCSSCKDIVDNGFVIHDEQHADYVCMAENDYARDGIMVNYRDEK